MYKKILVPLDGSKRSEKILPHVEGLAQRYGAKIILLRVARYPQLIGYGVPEIERYRENSESIREHAFSNLNLIAGEFREKGIDAKAKVTEGPVVRKIVDTAVAEKADLIAMSSHGRTGLSRAFYGSVTAGVMHQVDRPILIIRSL